MFGKKAENLEFKLVDDKRWILEETQNQMKVLQYGMWGDAADPIDPDKCKYETRTVFTNKDGNEVMGKGCSFSDDGINELTRVLVSEGLGNTKDLLEGLSTRSDFLPSLKRILKDNPDASDINLDDVDDEYFAPSSLFILNDEEEGA